MKKKDLIDKWNKLAIRKIKINDSFQIAVGRLIFVAIIQTIISISQLLAGAPPAAIFALWGNAFLGLEKRDNKEKKD